MEKLKLWGIAYFFIVTSYMPEFWSLSVLVGMFVEMLTWICLSQWKYKYVVVSYVILELPLHLLIIIVL